MVERHRPPSGAVLVKSGRPAHLKQHHTRCLWPGCGAILAHDNASAVCSCHVNGYNLRHDKHAVELVYHLLLAAYPFSIDIGKTLGEPDWNVVRNIVKRLRSHGHQIEGCTCGYRLIAPAWHCRALPARARTVKACSR